MAKLTAKQRHKLPSKDFALPGGRYPINDRNHAKNALARVARHGSEQEKAKVRKRVSAKYPGIKVSGKGRKKNTAARKRVMVKA